MTRFSRIVMAFGLVVAIAAVQSPRNTASAFASGATPVAAPPSDLAKVEATLKSVLGDDNAPATEEAEEILASLRTVTEDKTAAANKRTAAQSILSALLTDETTTEADAAKAEALKTFFQVADSKTVRQRPLVRTMGTGCDVAIEERYTTNILGLKLWSYFHEINYCWSNQVLTKIERERWARTYWLFWHFEGHVVDNTYGGEGQARYRSVTQGHFDYCVGWQGVGCVQHWYPRSDLVVTAR